MRRLPYNHAMQTQLDKRFGFLVSDVGRLVGKRFDDLAKSSLDLTRAQCRALAYLSHYGEMNQARLADLLEVAPISAGRLLDRMEEGGWIERRFNPGDRRERQVRMTAKAQKALNAARRVGDEIAAEALTGFSAEESEQLIALLARVRSNLSTIVDR
ncbi:MarR family transcriptional regulator [Caballeronia telluris]|uniref:MarR family transcriptional regulator n=2 Tax=Burkholderiaceae TaxID=119060 RepID=A0A158KBD1_9BURK|nr:MarR family transcriptional regulator [Caballeronia telluris]